MKVNKTLLVKIITLAALLVFLFLLLFISDMNIKVNNRAVKYFNKGKFEAAAETFNKEIKNHPGNYDILVNSAGTDYKLNKLDEAQTKYAVVINSTDIAKEDKFAVFYNMGNVEFKKNNLEKAADFYKEALKLNPNDKDTKYNLEVALLKLNERNDQQGNKNSNKQNNNQNEKQENDKQKQQEQDLKKQMEQNNRDQKGNEKKRQEESIKNTDSKESDDEKQKELEKEKKEIDKQKKEISDKVKDLMNAQKDKEQSKQNNTRKGKKLQENKQVDKNESIQQNQMKKDDNEDIQAAIFLNYYNEADKNSNKLRKKNKESLVNQPQEDW
jgi:tetratricopeptide (TPR) repeat protein